VITRFDFKGDDYFNVPYHDFTGDGLTMWASHRVVFHSDHMRTWMRYNIPGTYFSSAAMPGYNFSRLEDAELFVEKIKDVPVVKSWAILRKSSTPKVLDQRFHWVIENIPPFFNDITTHHVIQTPTRDWILPGYEAWGFENDEISAHFKLSVD